MEAEKALIDLEKMYWQAMKENDVETALRLTEFPCIVAGPSGVREVDEASYRTMMERPTYRIDDVQLSDACVRQLGDDVAVIAYKVREELQIDGKAITLEASDTSTWHKRDGRWQCAMHSESIAGDPFGRKRPD